MKQEIYNSIWMISEKIIVMLSGILWMSLLTNSLAKEDFGDYQYIVSMVALCVPLVSMGLNGIANKEFLTKPVSFVLVNVFSIKFFLGILVFLLGLVFFREEEFLLWICYANILIVYSFQIFEVLNQSILRTSVTMKVRFSVILIFVFIKLFFVFRLNIDLHTCLLIQALEFWIYYLSLTYVSNFKKSETLGKLDFTYMKFLFSSGGVLVLSGFAESINLRIDQIFLKKMLGANEVAVYSVSARLSEVWYFFAAAIVTAFFPRLLEIRKKSNHLYYFNMRKLILFLLFFALLIELFLYLMGYDIIKIVFGDKYIDSYNVLLIHMLVMPFVYTRSVFSKWVILENKLKYSLYSHFLGALVNVCLNLVLIPVLGVYGATWATVISYFMSSFVFMFLFQDTRKYLKNIVNG